MGIRKELTGLKFGLLTVIEKAPSRKFPSGATIGYWKVRCDCGNEKEVCAQKIQTSKAVSCGKNCKFAWEAYRNVNCSVCGAEYKIKNGSIAKSNNRNKRVCRVCSAKNASNWAKNMEAHNRLPDGEAAFRSLFGAYKRNALNQRKVCFELTKEQFKEITSNNCNYCGTAPSSIRNGDALRSKGKSSGIYVYNGIDRVDSSKGYTIDNVVSCCSICNFMKRDMQVLEFMNHIEKIYKHK